MKISEVISKLEEIKAAHGDLEVASYNSNREDEGTVDKVQFCDKGKFGEKYYCNSGDGDAYDGQAYAVIVSDSWWDDDDEDDDNEEEDDEE